MPRKKNKHKHKVPGKGDSSTKRELGAKRHDHKDPRGGRLKPAEDKKNHKHRDKKKKLTGPAKTTNGKKKSGKRK